MTGARSQLPLDNDFDVDLANRLARLESYNKHHYRPNTYLHKWWGRRCGSTFRLILKGLADDPDRQGYYKAGGLEGKVILDPMCGGGTTLHEAIRMGAGVVGVDIDPIPILQARATLSAVPVKELSAALDSMIWAIDQAMGDLFMTGCPDCTTSTPIRYSLYGQRRRCDCSEVLVVDSLQLRQEPNGTILHLCPRCGQVHAGDRHSCSQESDRSMIVERGTTRCGRCNSRYQVDYQRPYYQRYGLLVVAGQCEEHGLFHKQPDATDRERLDGAEQRREQLGLNRDCFRVATGSKSTQLHRRGIDNYLDLFSSRQLLYIASAMAALPEHDDPARLILSLLLSTSLEFNSMLCGYKGTGKRRAGAVRHTFSHHAYSFPYTALENNPVHPQRASGTLRKLFQGRIVRARAWARQPLERRAVRGKRIRKVPITGELDAGTEVHTMAEFRPAGRNFLLHQASAADLPLDDGVVDAVITDPPYYDSIQYSDLAAFFRVWLRQMLPDAADWDYDLSGTAATPERSPEGDSSTENLAAIFAECRRVLRPETGRLVFTFHHWKPLAWSALTAALRQAGFALVNRYIVHAEHPMSVHINNMRALTHDAVLVLAPADSQRQHCWEAVEPRAASGSHAYTQDCATLLGWLLNQPQLAAEDVLAHWQRALA